MCLVSLLVAYGAGALVAAAATHGLDVDAAQFVGNKLLEATENKQAVILISESLDQALSLGDRIAPMYEGKLADILSTEEATKERIGALMGGVKEAVGS
jgi:simple sugar transport system ATP-binding protein